VSRDPAAESDFQNTRDLAVQHFFNRLKTSGRPSSIGKSILLYPDKFVFIYLSILRSFLTTTDIVYLFDVFVLFSSLFDFLSGKVNR